MIQVSQQYKEACSSSERPRSYITAKYGTFDKTIKSKIDSIYTWTFKKQFSNINKLYNDTKETKYNYISCEPNRVKLDDTFYFINDKTKANENENIAYWSNSLSNDLGILTDLPQIRIIFKEKVPFQELTFYFQEVCEEIDVYYEDEVNNNLAIRYIVGNDKLIVSTTTEGEKPTFTIKQIRILFSKTKNPYRYVKLNEIDFGQYNIFNKEILDINIIDELSIDSSELSANSLSLKLDNSQGQYDILNPKNKLKLLQEQQEITIYHNLQVGNKFEQLPLGTFLIKEFNVNNQSLDIEAYDDTYFMNKIYYGSKFYDNVEIKDILKDLFNYFSYSKYKIDDELDGIKLNGYIPNVSFKEALRLIAEAGACVINKTREGQTYIFKTYDPITKIFNRNEIFKENPTRNLYNNVIDLVMYNYTMRTENSEVLNLELNAGEHFVILNKYPILQDTLAKLETTNNDYEIVERYATSCKIRVTSKTQVKLKATLITVAQTSNYKAKQGVDINKNEYTIKKINNNLITSEAQVDEIASWKLNRSEVKYDFATPVMPYIEVGDTCQYRTRFNTTNTFIPTRLEFSKSILQYVEGE